MNRPEAIPIGALCSTAPDSSLDAFRADQDAAADHEDSDPYERFLWFA